MRVYEFITEGAGPNFRPTPEQQQEIADLYASGFSGADIAKEYKVSKGTISRFIGNLPNFKELRQQFYKAREEQGLQTGPKGITPDQVQQMANNFALGKNFNQLNKEFGIAPEHVLGKLKKLPNFEELLQQNTKARQEQGLLTLDDLGRKGTTPAQIDQMAKEYASGKSSRQVAKMFNLAQSNVSTHLAKRPDWEELKFQSLTNRSIKLGGTQSLTNRGINKPGSKGIHAIRRTGSPSGSVFEDQIMRSFEFITEEVGRVLDLTKNYPHYSVLKGKILDISPKGKYKLQIVDAEIIPGKKVSVKVGDTISINANFLKQALKESELEENWKKTLGAIGAAGALTIGAHNMMPPKTSTAVKPAVTAPAAAPVVNPDVSILAQTIWGEARSHGANGMLAVGNVINNRAEDVENSRLFGSGIRGVALKPKQFSCWNEGDPNRDRLSEILQYDRLISRRQSPDGTPFDEWYTKFKNTGDYMDYKAWLLAKDIAKKIVAGTAPDPTNGAVYYHTTAVKPIWRTKLDRVATIGNHIFYTLPEELSEYKVDNVEGLGSVPYNQNVDYFGLRVMMKPSTFLNLALPLNEPRSVEHIMQHMKNGGGLGAPFLDISIPAEWEEDDFTQPARITGHEGRNRMLAIQKLEGDDPVEVHLLLKNGWRARHLTPDMIKELQDGIMNQSRNRYVTGPLFSVKKA